MNDLILPASNLPTRIENFVGRISILNKIDESIFEKKKQIIILTSFAGTGKTSIANRYGYMFLKKNKNNFVYWMKSDANNLDLEFQKFAFDLEIQIDQNSKQDELIRKISNKLHNLSENILFIFDNCDHFNTNIEAYVTKLSLLNNIFILITTRDAQFASNLLAISYDENTNLEHIILEPFEKDECLDLIKKHLGNNNNNNDTSEYKELIDLFGYSKMDKIRPYVLKKMIALVKLKMGSFKKLKTFINELKAKSSQDMLKEVLKEDDLFDVLIEKEYKAWEVLKYVSFLDPDFIPVEFLTDLLLFNENDLNKYVDVFKRYSMISIEETNDSFGIKIHRTLQEEIQQYIKLTNDTEIIEIIDKYAQIVLEHLDKSDEEMFTNGYGKEKFYYNFKKIADLIIQSTNVSLDKKSKIAYFFGRYLNRVKFNNTRALTYLESSLDFDRKSNNYCDTLDTANILNNIGCVYYRLNKFDKALEYHHNNLEIKMKLFNNIENSSIAATLNNIGICYKKQGDNNKALDYLIKSVNIDSQLLENGDLNGYSITLYNIGQIYNRIGKYNDAFEYLDKSLTIKRKLFQNENTLSVADIFNSIGLSYIGLENYEEAKKILHKSLVIKRNFFENDNNSSIETTLQNINIAESHINSI